MEAVWWCVAVFPSWEKARLVITGGDFNAESYPDEIPQSVAIPYFRNLGVNAILLTPTEQGSSMNLGVEKMELPVLTSTSVNTCGISLSSCLSDQHNHTGLLEQMLLTEWGAIPHDQAGDQHQE